MLRMVPCTTSCEFLNDDRSRNNMTLCCHRRLSYPDKDFLIIYNLLIRYVAVFFGSFFEQTHPRDRVNGHAGRDADEDRGRRRKPCTPLQEFARDRAPRPDSDIRVHTVFLTDRFDSAIRADEAEEERMWYLRTATGMVGAGDDYVEEERMRNLRNATGMMGAGGDYAEVEAREEMYRG